MSEYSEVHWGETVDLTGQRLQDAQFHDCVITGLRNTWLVGCDMAGSKVDIRDPVGILDATLTVNCYTFKDVELSEMVFDSMIYLLSLGNGNDAKRRALREMVEPSRLRLFDRVFPQLVSPR